VSGSVRVTLSYSTCIERSKEEEEEETMAQELTDEEMNQLMDQYESVTDEEMNQLMDQYEAVSMTCTLCKKVIFRTLTLIFFIELLGLVTSRGADLHSPFTRGPGSRRDTRTFNQARAL